MFVIKKFISFFLSPLVIAFVLGLLGFYYFFKQKYKRAKLFFVLAFSWMFFISYDPIGTTMLSTLENEYEKLQTIPQEVTYILALGGDTKGRSYELLRLHHLNKDLKIITSGYEPKDSDGAVNTARILKESGIPKSTITIKDKSRDTKEEAFMMKKLVGNKPFILVTAAYHMPRAMALFKKLGLNPIAAPTNFLVNEKDWFGILSKRAWGLFEVALHEYIGLIWYNLKGDI